ncbi:MAG: VCBS repeat-containing protein, partial [Acidobacteria bacterium]|nr:VCBS repeat-containing protein [Acidobacteriota bacterium]
MSVCLAGVTACDRSRPASEKEAPPPQAENAVELPAAPESSAAPALPPYPEKLKPVTFSDVTARARIRFRHNNGAFGKKYLPETVGSGCAFFDYDRDGWLDILLINGMDFDDAPKKRSSTMALYHNNQDGSFTDVTARSGLTLPMYGMGVAIGDYDGDGWEDVFVTALGQNRLFRNLGESSQWRFRDVTRETGLAGSSGFSTSAAWLDYDRDGRLDLFVANYIDWSADKDIYCTLDGVSKSYCTPESYNGLSARLYQNRGAAGKAGPRFEDVTVRAGMLKPTAKSLGVATFDYNLDGWVDIFVANDTQPNNLYANNQDGTFREV